MKIKHILTLLTALLLATAGASAKKDARVQKMYAFGMAASFTDTIVHFTSIQEIDNAWFGKKGFLMGRENYSYQLRDFLADRLQMPHRTCIVVYDTKRKKLEKRFDKMKRLYTEAPKGARHYDVRHIAPGEFTFRTVDMSAEVEQQRQAEQEEQAAGKEAKKKDKKDKKGKSDRRPAQPGKDGDGGRRPPRG